MYHIKKIVCAVFMLLLIASCSSQQTVPKEQFSGYLGDYSKLQSTKDATAHEVLRWESSKLKSASYGKIILDPIVFYPKPKATSQVSSKTLNEMREYLNKALAREVGKVIPLTQKPGPGVLRFRTAITGAATADEELKGYEYIPIALIVVGVTKATGARDREAFVVLEAGLVDSTTGERLAMAVRKDKAKKLLENDEEKLTLKHVQPMLDDLAVQARKFVELNINKRKSVYER